ncbi:unnamed protein product [Aureobasidium pullulans]|nr:unnamed protein product [Aureobasidium pullulans]
MRPSTRLLAQATRYLTPGAPTGLTGLKQFPEHSVYRQSVEALTKHRLSIVESVKPEGLEEWQSRVRSVVEAHPNAFRSIASATNKNEVNIVYNETALKGMETEDYEDEPIQKQEPEGPRSQIEAGLIEEIILVAEAETALVDEMYKSKVWEDLEESPNQGQWAYYERDTHTPKTQAP